MTFDKKEVLNTMLDSLRDLYEGKLKYDYLGICSNLSVPTVQKYGIQSKLLSSLIDGIMKDCFKSWEFYSGNPGYPVPPTKVFVCEDPHAGQWAYNRAALNETLWDQDTQYGRLRMDLVGHMIKFIEKELGK